MDKQITCANGQTYQWDQDDKLGEGGFGAVFVGQEWSKKTNLKVKDVAVKLMNMDKILGQYRNEENKK